MYNNKWFTIMEVVIAISISTLIIIWLSFFIWEINYKIISSQKKWNIYIEINDFIDKMWVKKNLYWSSSIFTQNQNYNALLMTNLLQNSWILIWVVNFDYNSPYYLKLDPDSNKNIYNKKVLAMKQLTESQVSQIITNSWSIFSINFFEDNLYPNLLTKSFNLSDYNSWSIIEMKISFYENYLNGYLWKNLSEIPEIKYYDITLNF